MLLLLLLMIEFGNGNAKGRHVALAEGIESGQLAQRTVGWR